MARTKRWTITATGHSSCLVKVSSWKYFGDFIYQKMMNYDAYIWRGQRCDDWKLESTFDRLVRNARVSAAREFDFRIRHLEQFKYAARGRRGPNPPVMDSEDAWWALGQHHGLSTPLLDWTTSPFVAAFFAFNDIGDPQTRNRAIYALHRPAVRTRARMKAKQENERRKNALEEADREGKVLGSLNRGILESTADPEVVFIKPLSDENQRLVSQGGLFTRAPQGKTIEQWVEDNPNPEDKGYILLKILVPDRDRENCLRNLNRMNINHLSLFPDLYGSSRFCNLFSEVSKY